jgi:hypothetical protein
MPTMRGGRYPSVVADAKRPEIREAAVGEATDRRRPTDDVTPAVYGSLLVTTLVAVQWRHDVSTTFLGLTLVASVAVFWLAHVWAETVNHRVHGPVDRGEIVGLARAESPMLAAAVVPTLVLALGSIGVLATDTAVGLALSVSMVQLFVWGWIVGRAAHASRWLAFVVATLDLLLGMAIVTLEVVVLH